MLFLRGMNFDSCGWEQTKQTSKEAESFYYCNSDLLLLYYKVIQYPSETEIIYSTDKVYIYRTQIK